MPLTPLRTRTSGRTAVGIILLLATAAMAWVTIDAKMKQQQFAQDRSALLTHALSRSVTVFLDAAVKTAESMAREAEAEPALTKQYLQPLVTRFAEQNQNAYVSMYVIGLDGVEIADYQPEVPPGADHDAGIGVDLVDRPYFQELLEFQKPVISEPVIGRSTKRPVVVVIAPIFNKSGKMVAAAAGSLDLSKLQNISVRATGSDSLHPVVVDKSGTIVVHQDPLAARTLRSVRGQEMAERALAGETGTSEPYLEYDGRMYVAAYAPVVEYGWAVWVAQEASAQNSTALLVALSAWLTPLLLAAAALSLMWGSRDNGRKPT